MRPTKGEMSVTPASAHATACAKEKRSVMLQWMPSRSSFSAARMPSHVAASILYRGVHQVAEARVLRRGEEQRWIGGGVLGLPARHRLDVAGVGDDQRMLAQGIEL